MKKVVRFLYVFLGLLSFNAAHAQVWCDDLYSTSDYCLTGDNGVFYCISTDPPEEPEDMNCESTCNGAETCHHIHIRNVTNSTAKNIKTIKITVFRDTNSSQYLICKPVTNWGWSPWTSEWTIKEDVLFDRLTETCYDWNIALVHELVFTPPNNSYWLTDANHWSVTICGASSFQISIEWDTNPPGWCSPVTPTITSSPCPPQCP